MKKFGKLGERGATAIEYGLILSLIALAIIPAMSALSGGNNGLFTGVVNKVVAATAHVR